MTDTPPLLWLLPAGALAALGIFGVRGLLDIREALTRAELSRLSAPAHWRATRAWVGICAAIPVIFAASSLGRSAWLAGFAVAALGYSVAPLFLAAARQRVEREVLDDLALHLDLIALAMESGNSLSAALSICADRTPPSALQRAWVRVILEIHTGTEPVEALRALEQRLGLRPFASLVTAVRSAERFNHEPAQVLRERARQSAAHRFARAERRARAAPLKLWAALVLCLAPCTLVVLAFPVARGLAIVLGR
jgi:tight adherence protein C